MIRSVNASTFVGWFVSAYRGLGESATSLKWADHFRDMPAEKVSPLHLVFVHVDITQTSVLSCKRHSSKSTVKSPTFALKIVSAPKAKSLLDTMLHPSLTV
jgi:hypothetical protein